MDKPYDVGPGDKVNPGDPVTVNRYTPAARINHWITAASLVLLALSGLSLFHPSLFFLTGLFGGGETTRAIHPWIGVVLFFGFLGLFLRFWLKCPDHHANQRTGLHQVLVEIQFWQRCFFHISAQAA